MKNRIRIIVLLLLVAGTIAYFSWKSWQGKQSSELSTIVGNGVFEATEIDISAEVAGRLMQLLPREGDDVQQGELLAILGDSIYTSQLTQAEGNLQANEAALAELRAGTRSEDIRRVQAQYDTASDAVQQARQMRSLVYAGAREELLAQLAARVKQASAQLALLKAGPRSEDIAALEASYRAAKAQVELVKAGPRDEELQQLQAALAQARVNLNDADTELQRTKRLYQQGAIPLRTVEVAQARYDTQKTVVDAAQARLLAANNGARPLEITTVEQSAQVAYERWQSAIKGARPQEIEAAAAALEMAQQQLNEAKAGARPQERGQADAQLASAEAGLRAARAALDLVKNGPRKETVTAAEARVKSARGQLAGVRERDSKTEVFAPTAGRVTLRVVEPGEMVGAGLPLLRIARLDKLWIRVYLPETSIGQVKIGQQAIITTDAYTKHRYHGKIITIAEEPEFTPKNAQTREERVKLVFAVKIEVANPDHELKPGMPGDATIDLRP